MTLFADALLRRRALAVALGVGAFLLAAGARSAEPKVLAKIDGVPITEEDVNDALEDIGPGLPQKLDGPARQQYALDYLIDMKLVAKKAAADKMDSGPDFARRMAYYHDKLAMEAVLTDSPPRPPPTTPSTRPMTRPPKRTRRSPKFTRAIFCCRPRTRPRPRWRASRRARISPRSPPSSPRIPAAKAAISAGSPRTRWCPNSPTPPSRWSPARFPIR